MESRRGSLISLAEPIGYVKEVLVTKPCRLRARPRQLQQLKPPLAELSLQSLAITVPWIVVPKLLTLSRTPNPTISFLWMRQWGKPAATATQLNSQSHNTVSRHFASSLNVEITTNILVGLRKKENSASHSLTPSTCSSALGVYECWIHVVSGDRFRRHSWSGSRWSVGATCDWRSNIANESRFQSNMSCGWRF